MHTWFSELTAGWPDAGEIARMAIRLAVAMTVGALAGINRERLHKAAGLRTHILVSLGAATFAIGGEMSGMDLTDLARITQGVAVGVGFIGAGAIIKSQSGDTVHGLTTAASIWLTAAAGGAAGMGRLGLALIAGLLTWFTLAVVVRFEGHPRENGESSKR